MRSRIAYGNEWPLAYLLTFTCYGTWLHGRDPGSVDREHNVPGTPVVEPDAARVAFESKAMQAPPYRLEGEQPWIVLAAIQRLCWRRRWMLRAAHVRRTHVHAVVSASQAPESVVSALKSEASRALTGAGCGPADTRRWTRHGSMRYLWDEEAIAAAIEYVLCRQGEPLAVYPRPDEAIPYRAASESPGNVWERSP